MLASKKKGFTLVELLIVIVVVGILAAMMVMSAAEAVSTAKASNIISNLRNLKTAVMAWYFDHVEQLEIGTDFYFHGYTKSASGESYHAHKTIGNYAKYNDAARKDILRYMNNNDDIQLNVDGDDWKEGHYRVFDTSANNINNKDSSKANLWFIGYHLGNDKRLRQKLAGRAKSLGLLKNAEEFYDGTTNQVWLKILEL